MARQRGKLGLVLSGGGARGAFQVGVVEQLLRDERFAAGPRVVSGTSAGAINAALIAAGKSPRQLMEFWNGIADDPPVVASARFFDSAARSLARMGVEETLRSIVPGRRWRDFLKHARHHWPPRRGSLLALWVEYLLTARYELVNRLLQSIQEPFVARTDALRARLLEALGGEQVPSGKVRLAINTVDVHSGRVVRYVNADTPQTSTSDYVCVDAITVDMVLASASIPLLFPPVEIDRRWLWDGGLLVNTPLAPVVALGADEIVTVLVTEPPDPDRGPLAHFGRAVERTVDSFLENAYNVDRKLLLERNRLARRESGYRDVTLYEAVRPGRHACFDAGSYLYFDRRVLAGMRSEGRRAAKAWLAAGPRPDRLEVPAAAA
jgi:NTE family protein